jgi:hypothetical protein
VPNLWDKTPEAPSPAELNPLTNPLLEQHLGRWAKIYFSTPPAKRDQAVSNLLEEIKRESGTSSPGHPGRPYFATDTKFERPVCSACQHHNPPGHKFCSRCGQALNLAQASMTEAPRAPEGVGGLPRSSMPSSAPNSAPNFAPNFAPNSVPNFAPNSANETQWVREQTFSSLNDSYGKQGRGWKYLVGLAAIGLAGFAYFHWAPEFRTRAGANGTPQAFAPVPAAALPQNTSLSTTEDKEKTIAPAPQESGTPEAQRRSPTTEVHDRAVVPAGIQRAAQKSAFLGATSSRQTFEAEESGISDLRLAQRYLEGGMGARDPSVAARLLWKSVRQQNSTAAILLSDLYLRGDGVARSCDQARLLLVAAAKRGSPQAAQQLRNMELQGCQ